MWVSKTLDSFTQFFHKLAQYFNIKKVNLRLAIRTLNRIPFLFLESKR
ncbi:hypothetical protein [Streptococcus pseudopneumoniae]